MRIVLNLAHAPARAPMRLSTALDREGDVIAGSAALRADEGLILAPAARR